MSDRLDETINSLFLIAFNEGGLPEEEAKDRASALTGMAMLQINAEVEKARFDELTSIGRLLNGSRKKLIDHYEERYNHLNTQESEELDE